MKTLGYCGCCAVVVMIALVGSSKMSAADEDTSKTLPPPVKVGGLSLEEAIAERRSVRAFLDEPLSLEQISQLCWAGQGITDPGRRFRASPSAGALFPIELYVVTAEGVDHYLPHGHRLARHLAGDRRQALGKAAHHQEAVSRAPVCFAVTAVVERTARKYG